MRYPSLPRSLTPQNLARIAVAALLLGASATAFTPILVRLSEIGPNATAFWRLALAVPAFSLLIIWQERTAPATPQPVRGADYRWLIVAGLFFASDLATWHWSLKYTSVANSVILVSASPLFVTLGAWWLFGQRVGLLFLVGLAVAMLGAMMLVGASFSLSRQNLLGDSLALLTALFYGGYILTVKHLRRTFSTITVLSWSSTVGGIVLLVVTLLSNEPLFAASWAGWAVLFGLGFVSQVSGQGLIAYALAHLPAPFSALMLLIQPTLASLLAWAILHEALGPWQAVGGVAVLIGILLARQDR